MGLSYTWREVDQVPLPMWRKEQGLGMDPAALKVYPEDFCPTPHLCLTLGSFGRREWGGQALLPACLLCSLSRHIPCIYKLHSAPYSTSVLPSTCALSGLARTCHHRIRLGDSDSHYYISPSSRARVSQPSLTFVLGKAV